MANPPIRGKVTDKDGMVTSVWAAWFRDLGTAIVAGITGAITTVLTNNLSDNKVVVSNAEGKIAVSSITNDELYTLQGVNGNIQGQLDGMLSNADAQTVFLLLDQDSNQSIVNGSPIFTHPLIDTDQLNSLNLNNRTAYDSSEIPAFVYEQRYMYDAAGVNSIGWNVRQLYTSTPLLSMDYENHRLYYSDGITISIDYDDATTRDTDDIQSLNWSSREGIDSSNNTSFNWEDRQLLDSTEALSVDYDARILYKSDGTTVALDWENDTPVISVGATAPITSTGGQTPVIGITGQALTKTDDTNVTLTLGGTPASALVTDTSLTLGWTGDLSVPRGGSDRGDATAYMPICGGTTSTGAHQSVATGSVNQVLTYVSSSALPTFQDPPVKMASFRSIDNATATTPGTVDGTLPYTYYDVALGATTQGNVIVSGSSSDWVSNDATKFEWKYVGTANAWAQLTLITWSDGSNTSPYYFLGAHKNGAYDNDQFSFISNSGYNNPTTVGWAGSVVTNDVIAFKLAQTNGTPKAVTFKNSMCHIISTRINT